MAIIRCKECNREISDKVHACPYCDSPLHLTESNINCVEPVSGEESETDTREDATVNNVEHTDYVDCPQEQKIFKRIKKWLVVIIVSVLLVGGAMILFVMRGHFVKSVEIKNDKIYLGIGDTARIEYSVSPAIANHNMKITSDDEDVVSIDENGRIEAIGEGDCILSVAAPNGKEDSIEIRVSELYSEWDFYFIMNSSGVYYKADYIKFGKDVLSIRFYENQFKLITDTVIEGNWTRKNVAGDSSTFALTLDDGGSIEAAMAHDESGEVLLALYLPKDITVYFRKK